MRNIFFRGFDEVSRQWIHGSLLKFLITGDQIEYAIRDINHKSITVNAESVGQLIERDDINDVPAYEGDIIKVQVEQLITTIEAVGYIEIINTAGGAHVMFDDHSISVPLSAFEEFEIVGNGAECLKADKDVEIKPDEKGTLAKEYFPEVLTEVAAGNAADISERIVDLNKTDGGDTIALNNHDYEIRLFELISSLGFVARKKDNCEYELIKIDPGYCDIFTEIKSLFSLAGTMLSKIDSTLEATKLIKFIQEYSLFLDEQHQIKKGASHDSENT